ncbi:MAG TPA: GNAT family N-acetyltransferase [Candidatus Dormibacteraeota bacterium]|nr:GNAT family N-acetyltransferase [Candidatus Dormibacteraeota bacterium]
MPGRPDREKPKFRFEPLDTARHDRAAFSCEHEILNTYLRERANQEVKKRVTAVYVLTPDGKTIAGFYTLSQFSIDAGELPPDAMKRLRIPRYDKLPATLLGRLARSEEFKGCGLGEILLMGALKRALEHSRNIASLAIVVDAIDEKARAFYQAYGFIDIPDRPNRLFIPMRTVGQLFPEVA